MANNPTLSAQNSHLKETSLRYMLKLAAPMIVTNISFTVMQFVDRFMVSRLGTDALAAVLPAGVLSFVPASFALGVSTSINTFVSQSMGRGNLKDCSAYCWQGFYMGIMYIAVVIAILWPAAPVIFHLMGHDPSVVAMEVIYFRILLLSQGFAAITWCTSQFFMGVHRPVITMYAAVISQTVNITANYVLIFGKFGLPAMGIAGAGWGTFIGIGTGAAIRAFAFLNGNINRKFKSRVSVNLAPAKMKQLLRVGVPSGFGLLTHVALWAACLFWLVGLFGKESLAATSVVFSCINVSVMPIVGIGAALTAAVGKSIGNGMSNLAIKQTRICLRVAVLYMGLAGICFFVFKDVLMNFWSSDDQVVRAGVNILVCAAIFQIFDAATIIYTGALRGAGDTMWLAVVAMFGSVVILGGGGFVLVKTAPGLGPLGPWIAATVNIIAVGLANRWRFKSNHWMKINIFERGPVAVPVEMESAVE